VTSLTVLVPRESNFLGATERRVFEAHSHVQVNVPSLYHALALLQVGRLVDIAHIEELFKLFQNLLEILLAYACLRRLLSEGRESIAEKVVSKALMLTLCV